MADRNLKNSDSGKIKNTTVFCVKCGMKILLLIFSLKAAVLESKIIKVSEIENSPPNFHNFGLENGGSERKNE